MSEEDRKNYERSYESMWKEIYAARVRRDAALKMVDAAIDLVISLRHDMGDGTTKVTLRTMDALNTLQRLARPFDEYGKMP